MRDLVLVLALGASAIVGCGGSQPSLKQTYSTSTCPGAPPLHCLTTPECSYDLERQCNMCRCSSAGGEPSSGPVNAEGIPPIH
jgi:hypothetical protein